MLLKFMLGVVLLAPVAQTLARPAAWYWWASRVGDQRICAQTSPGEAWYRDSAAYKDSQCSIRVTPF